MCQDLLLTIVLVSCHRGLLCDNTFFLLVAIEIKGL